MSAWNSPQGSTGEGPILTVARLELIFGVGNGRGFKMGFEVFDGTGTKVFPPMEQA